MKLSTLFLLLTIGSITAFAPQPLSRQCQQASSTSQLHLFGGGAKKDGEKKGPGMLDQLAMLKKAQEMAQKKSKLDQELAAMDFKGTSSNGKVETVFKYIPSKNPMDPTPEYDPVSFDFDDEWFQGASTEDISTAVKEAIMNAIASVNQGVEEKYMVLKGDIQETFGALGASQS